MKRQSQELDTDDDDDDNQPLSQRIIPCLRVPEGRLITKTLTQSGQPKSGNMASGTISLLLTDPDLLDCPICANPLHSVIYQCENGHIACSNCRIEVKSKCPTCSEQITFSRCRAMEKMIESMRFECENKTYGCKQTLTYSEKTKHEKICPNTPCHCPIPSCGFANSCKALYCHFRSDHKSNAILFTYNTAFSFGVDKSQKYVIVQEQNEGVIFVLKHSVKRSGRAFSVDCIGPPSSERAYTFELRVKNMDSSLSLESVPEVHAKFDHGTPSKKFLLIPLGMSQKCGQASVKLCIEKVKWPIVEVDTE